LELKIRVICPIRIIRGKTLLVLIRGFIYHLVSYYIFYEGAEDSLVKEGFRPLLNFFRTLYKAKMLKKGVLGKLL
jgi:hypothetical protein